MDIREFAFDAACITGLSPNLASFLPKQFYSPTMSVDDLTALAAYSIRAAKTFTPEYVDGLDVAVYRDAPEGIGEWEFVDIHELKKTVDKLDARIRAAFTHIA